MIYLVTEAHRYTMQGWIESERSWEMCDHVRIVHYQDLPKIEALPAETLIFSDIERLTPLQTDVATQAWEAARSTCPDLKVFNHPTKSLRRCDLLRKLHEEGWNDFRAVRPMESLDGLRYPVFVREENEHTGSMTGLLGSRQELDRALRKLNAKVHRLVGRKLLVVEFCDTSGGTGIFEKYSAFRVGDQIIPRYYTASKRWMVKARALIPDQEYIERERVYMDTNPHESRLREIFELAQIEYGRIDYSMLGDRVQVWEINTNPTIGPVPAGKPRPPWSLPEELQEMRMVGKHMFDRSFVPAMKEIDKGEPGKTIGIGIDSSTARRLRVETAAQLWGPRLWRLLARAKRLLRSKPTVVA